MKYLIQSALVCLLIFALASCDGGGGRTNVHKQIRINMVPTSASVPLGATQTFNAFLNGTGTAAIQTANWSVNGVAGGNSAVGTITAAGVYTAPASFPSANSVTITAALQSNT